jgi:hypothetical protein
MGEKDARLLGLIGDPSIAGMDHSGGFTQQDVIAEGRRQKGRLPTTLVELQEGLNNRAAQREPPTGRGMMGTPGAMMAPPQRQATPEDLMAQANEVLDRQRVQHDTLTGQGPSTGVRDEAGGKLPEWLTRYMDKEP